MSRVEPKDERDRADSERRTQQRNEQPKRTAPSPNPSKAEGDEKTVDDALNRER